MWSLQVPPWWEYGQIEDFTIQAHASIRTVKFFKLLESLNGKKILLSDIAYAAGTNVKQLGRMTQPRKQGSTCLDYRIIGVINRLLTDYGIPDQCDISTLWPATDELLTWTVIHVLFGTSVAPFLNPSQASEENKVKTQKYLEAAKCYVNYMIKAHGKPHTNFVDALKPLTLIPKFWHGGAAAVKMSHSDFSTKTNDIIEELEPKLVKVFGNTNHVHSPWMPQCPIS